MQSVEIGVGAVGETLRNVMRHIPSPVVVVTAANETGARGITIGSFTSVSLDPALISFNVWRAARIHELVSGSERFAVHLLSERHQAMCRRFALRDLSSDEQFDGVRYRLEGHLPILNDALSVLLCCPYAIYPAGDHSIIVGQVESIRKTQEGPPVLYHNRSYCGVGHRLA